MARVKNGATTKARHKKVLKQAKGYFGSKHRLYKTAKEQLMHSGQYAYRDRKQKKRDFRKLWITRINAACREEGISYSRFIEGLNKAGVEINRKVLSEIAINDKEAFANLVKVANDGKAGKIKITDKIVETEVTINSGSSKKSSTKQNSKEESNTKKSSSQSTNNVDYTKMTVAELKEAAKEKGISGVTGMKKADLIAALEK